MVPASLLLIDGESDKQKYRTSGYKVEFSKGESSLQIRYLNTDLDLAAAVDLRSLATTFESQGIVPLHVAPIEDDGWKAIFETNQSYPDPESNIAAILSVIEQFEQPELRIWQALTLCEFNIGYDSGSEPWAFNQGLSHELLQRITKVGASLRFTLYPPESEHPRKFPSEEKQ